MRSLKTRLNLGLVTAALVIFSAMMLYASWAVPRITETQLITRLKHDRDSLLAGLSKQGDAGWQLASERLPLVYEQPFSGHYFVIRGGDVSLRSPSLWDQTLPPRALSPGADETIQRVGPRGQQLLVLYSAVEKRNETLTLAVAEDVSAIQSDIRQFQWVLAGTGVFGFLTFLIVQQWLLKRGFGQLARVRGQLAELDRGTIERIPSSRLYSEIAPLVDEINRLVVLMRERTELSRHLLGNLAHTLKTPLTLLLQMLEDPALDQAPDLRASLHEQAERIRAVIERQLKRARLATPGTPGSHTAVAPVVDDLLDAMARIHREQNIEARAGIDEGAFFRGDPEDLTELLGVLLDNAFKWGRSQVSVRAASANGLQITVEDDGPGCPDDQLAGLTERGKRLDETRPGSGLGLAIASDIVAHYGGVMTLENAAPGGGLRASVEFPEM